MKKIICFVMLISLLLPVLCGCGEKHTSAADTYLDIAQGYVDEGDYSAAMSALKKGYEATGDSRIAVMMADLAVQMEETNESEPTETTVEPTEVTAESESPGKEEPEETLEPTERTVEVIDSDSPYVGQWQDTWSQRANITITASNAGYDVLILWASGASEVSKWEMTAVDAEGDSLFSNNCKRTIEYCDEAGNVTEEVIYTGGQVTLGIFDGVLHWFDYTEEAGENCRFKKVGAGQHTPKKIEPSFIDKVNLEDYFGIWKPKLPGSVPFDISVEINDMGDMGSLRTIYYIAIYAESGVHEIMGEFGTYVLSGNTFETEHTDFCGHSGKMKITFYKDRIAVELKQPGLPDIGELVLIRT